MKTAELQPHKSQSNPCLAAGLHSALSPEKPSFKGSSLSLEPRPRAVNPVPLSSESQTALPTCNYPEGWDPRATEPQKPFSEAVCIHREQVPCAVLRNAPEGCLALPLRPQQPTAQTDGFLLSSSLTGWVAMGKC